MSHSIFSLQNKKNKTGNTMESTNPMVFAIHYKTIKSSQQSTPENQKKTYIKASAQSFLACYCKCKTISLRC